MNFQDAEKTYKDLKAQHDSGKLSDSTFEAEVGKLRMQDAQGRWWQIGVQTGEWYMHDGQKWNKAKPPIASPAPGEPAPSSEVTAVIPRPGAKSKTGAPAAAEPMPKKNGGAALPARLFSSKPAGRDGGGGLSRNALVAIIAGVAVICIILAVVGYNIVQGYLGGARTNIVAGLSGTATPTRNSLLLPTIPPTLPPKPTDTPLPPPTPVVTTTIPLPPTVAPTPAAARATATRKPAGSPTPAVSPTQSVAPGLYVLKLETVPSKIDVGGGDKVKVGFKMTLLNSTGTMQTRKLWFVRVFAEPEQTTGDRAYTNSYGESIKADVNIGTGTVEVTTPEHVQFGTGRCNYVAVPYYTDDNNIAVPFQTVKGDRLYYAFKVCQ